MTTTQPTLKGETMTVYEQINASVEAVDKATATAVRLNYIVSVTALIACATCFVVGYYFGEHAGFISGLKVYMQPSV